MLSNVIIAKFMIDGTGSAGMLNDYLDGYVLKIERDEAIEIIRNCQRALAGYLPRDGGEKELIARLIEILETPRVGAVTARSGKFISHVS